MRMMDDRVLAVLRRAGWYPGRVAPRQLQSWIRQLQDEGFELSIVAAEVLAQYGGLAISQSGPGEEIARAGFAFTPLAALGELEYLRPFGEALHTTLFPIGEAEDGRAFLLIAGDGRVVAVQDNAWILGTGIEAALEALVLGRKGQLFIP